MILKFIYFLILLIVGAGYLVTTYPEILAYIVLVIAAIIVCGIMILAGGIPKSQRTTRSKTSYLNSAKVSRTGISRRRVGNTTVTVNKYKGTVTRSFVIRKGLGTTSYVSKFGGIKGSVNKIINRWYGPGRKK